jgi:hypothetical protein
VRPTVSDVVGLGVLGGLYLFNTARTRVGVKAGQ